MYHCPYAALGESTHSSSQPQGATADVHSSHDRSNLRTVSQSETQRASDPRAGESDELPSLNTQEPVTANGEVPADGTHIHVDGSQVDSQHTPLQVPPSSHSEKEMDPVLESELDSDHSGEDSGPQTGVTEGKGEGSGEKEEENKKMKEESEEESKEEGEVGKVDEDKSNEVEKKSQEEKSQEEEEKEEEKSKEQKSREEEEEGKEEGEEENEEEEEEEGKEEESKEEEPAEGMWAEMSELEGCLGVRCSWEIQIRVVEDGACMMMA